MERNKQEFKCIMCGYSWTPRVALPRECPDCKTRYWKDEENENE